MLRLKSMEITKLSAPAQPLKKHMPKPPGRAAKIPLSLLCLQKTWCRFINGYTQIPLPETAQIRSAETVAADCYRESSHRSSQNNQNIRLDRYRRITRRTGVRPLRAVAQRAETKNSSFRGVPFSRTPRQSHSKWHKKRDCFSHPPGVIAMTC